jgi:hypothetical protein
MCPHGCPECGSGLSAVGFGWWLVGWWLTLNGLWFVSGVCAYWSAPTPELKRCRLERIISGFVSAHTFGQWEFFAGEFRRVRPPLRSHYAR